MKNKIYWAKRATQLLLENERNTNAYLNRLNVLYKNTSKSIDNAVEKIFNTYKKDFTADEAKAWLNEEIPRFEYDKLKADLSDIKDERYKKQALMRLNAPAYRFRITRLQQLKQAIMTELSKAADVQLQLSKDCYVDTLKYSYERTMFDIQQGVGFAFDFAKLPQSTVNRLLSSKWYGRNFSSSIWRNRGLVANQASKIIIEGVLSGQSIPQMSKALLEQTYTKNMYNATRLIRTEVNYFSNQGALESYKEAELDKYEFCATLDLHTSKLCSERDGNIYPLDSAVVGENYPPMHPYCRSCAIPIIETEGLKRMNKRRMRNPITGKNEIVDNMNYADWGKKYVENSSKLSEAKEFTGGNKSDIISIGRDNVNNNYGAVYGALNPDSREAMKHAENYYESVRKMKTDCKSIAENIGWDEQLIIDVKNHIFLDKHSLGRREPSRFDPDYHMAQSWQRLIDGKDIQEMDIVLLQHEAMERKLMKENGMSYQQAHDITVKTYDYSDYVKRKVNGNE